MLHTFVQDLVNTLHAYNNIRRYKYVHVTYFISCLFETKRIYLIGSSTVCISGTIFCRVACVNSCYRTRLRIHFINCIIDHIVQITSFPPKWLFLSLITRNEVNLTPLIYIVQRLLDDVFSDWPMHLNFVSCFYKCRKSFLSKQLMRWNVYHKNWCKGMHCWPVLPITILLQLSIIIYSRQTEQQLIDDYR